MSRNRQLPEAARIEIERLDAEGVGVGTGEGFSLRVHGALPGETAGVRVVRKRRRRLEVVAETIRDPNPDRITPDCPHAGRCGGCALQHLAPAAQRDFKRDRLAALFAEAGVAPGAWLPDVTGPTRGYRRKARLGARLVPGRGVLVGFRERGTSRVAEVEACRVLAPAIGEHLAELRALLGSLEAAATIPQVEIAVGDADAALVLRTLEPLGEADLARVTEAARRHGWQLYLQPGGTDTTRRLWPPPEAGPETLRYALPEYGLEYDFHPQEFTQVNAAINRAMVAQALDLLAPSAADRVLDLFCGSGNFTLPLAGRSGEVHGVEGSEALVSRARANAAANGIANVSFAAMDLYADDFDVASLPAASHLLLDPPRSGAERICRGIGALAPQRIVYVSCRPDTLARDARLLADAGYRLSAAGILDMFPHTAHVESMAVFDAS